MGSGEKQDRWYSSHCTLLKSMMAEIGEAFHIFVEGGKTIGRGVSSIAVEGMFYEDAHSDGHGCGLFRIHIIDTAFGARAGSGQPAAPERRGLAFLQCSFWRRCPRSRSARCPRSTCAPPAPAVPAWVSERFGMGSTHWGDGLAADCFDLHNPDE